MKTRKKKGKRGFPVISTVLAYSDVAPAVGGGGE